LRWSVAPEIVDEAPRGAADLDWPPCPVSARNRVHVERASCSLSETISIL
jgi:hypothetical protein